jgi:2-polyprenyl-3-methyl-5-hydroxy-6-metoxy-1,4-benzoquinol methylase
MVVSVAADNLAAAFPALVCPIDQLPLTATNNVLRCSGKHEFQVRGGIPRMVAPETQYADAFGEQWNTFRLTQLDSYTNSTISRDRLIRCLGDSLWRRLNGAQPIHVLETGCGAGRFTEVLLNLPGARVTSADLSSAVDANQINCPTSQRHRIIQCDINAMPFLPESFDIVLCLGVIQHTPSPEQTIEALHALTKPGGWLVIDHYAPSLSYYTKIPPLILRPILKRLSPRAGMKATELLTKTFFPLHKMVSRKRWMQIILSRVSPLLTYFQAYPQLSDRLQYEWALLDTHDHLTDYYKHFRTVSEIRADLEKLGAEEIWVARGGNGVEARCRKPGR